MMILANKCFCLNPARHPHASYCVEHVRYVNKKDNNPHSGHAGRGYGSRGAGTNPQRMYAFLSQ